MRAVRVRSVISNLLQTFQQPLGAVGKNSYWSCAFFFFHPVWLKSLPQSIISSWKITRKFIFHQIKTELISSLNEISCLKPLCSRVQWWNLIFAPFLLSLFSSSNIERGKIRRKREKRWKEWETEENKSYYFFQFLSWHFLLLEKLRCYFDPSSASLENLYTK